MLQESSIVFETENGRAWVIKRGSTAYEREFGRGPTCDPTPAAGSVGPWVWEVCRTAGSTHGRTDSVYPSESLAVARAKYIGDQK